MRNEFSWYFDSLDVDHKRLWDKAVLSIDANVLLDLYRYHRETSETILSALESFKDRVWLTHQAASEFVRNRKAVIVDASNAIAKSANSISEMRKASEKARNELTNHRVLSRALIEELYLKIEDAILSANSKIADEKASFPNHLDKDEILARIVKIFDGRVGAAPDDMEEAKKEAARRIEKQIPPGYMDKKKDDDRAYGDYFVWRQLLDFSNSEDRPIIFVTSDAKEDWWEIKSGKTLGPRQELIMEAAKYSGQPVVLYQLENFLRHYEKASGTKNSGDAIDEVIALAEERSETTKRLQLVKKHQHIVYADAKENYGIIEVDLSRPAQKFTVTGGLNPSFDSSPHVDIELAEAPDGVDGVDLFVNTGTTFDFNIHVKSQYKGQLLPAGTYVFSYQASCLEE